MRFIKFLFPLFILVSLMVFGQLADAPLTANNNPDSTQNNISESPRFYLYKPDPNIKVDENRFKAGLMFDVENRRIVWQKEMSNVYPIASLTKMMVALLTVEDVHAGKFHWDDQVQWTREYVTRKNKKYYRSYAPASYSLHDLFKNSMIASNNEAAEQMARYLGNGDLDASIQRMNVRARELGMNATYYGNPTGLPARSKAYDNSSTPSDLLLLTIEMLKHPEITHVTGMDYAAINNGKNVNLISNHNRLAIEYKGDVDGMKTGYTRRAGFCLVATSNKCDHRLISIVLGARAPITRNEIVKNMFNDYYASIGSDPLDPKCASPQVYSTTATADEDSSQSEGEYVYRTNVVFKPYVVKKGEHLTTIAGKFSCTTGELRSWNHLKKKSGLRAGQKLIVRTTVREKVWVTKQDEAMAVNNSDSTVIADVALNDNIDKSNTHLQAKAQTAGEKTSINSATVSSINKVDSNGTDSSEKYIYHTVQRGDTLFKIAQRYKVSSVKVLKELNNLSNAAHLKPGMKLKVPST